MRFSEETLQAWTIPPSDTEEQKLQNAERMVRDAIGIDGKLQSYGINVFCQGSYANNTNIKLDSDIDINVNLTDAFYFDLPIGTKREDFGLGNPYNYSYKEFKDDVESALIAKFGRQNVKRKNKCITVKENTYRAEIDVVPTWKHRWYRNNGTYADGVVLFADEDNKEVINYPLQHIQNGKLKNENTHRRFKKVVRIFKKVRVKMEEDNYYVNSNISSFLLECLVWNCPNKIFNDNYSWNDIIKSAIIFLYNNTRNEGDEYTKWGEVSDLLYLFHNDRKWSRQDVNVYLLNMWNYMEY
jgi:hypothetical protein